MLLIIMVELIYRIWPNNMSKNKKIFYSLLAVISIGVGVYVNILVKPKPLRDTSRDVVIGKAVFTGQKIHHEDPKIREHVAKQMKEARERAKKIKDIEANPEKYRNHRKARFFTNEDYQIIRETKARIELKRKEYVGKTIDILKDKNGKIVIKDTKVTTWDPGHVMFSTGKFSGVIITYSELDEEMREKLEMEADLYLLIGKYAREFGNPKAVRY
jgi:hypothetical protein